jgi:hypothetical protein
MFLFFFHAANSMWICERLCWRSMHLGYVCCRKPVSSQVDLSELIESSCGEEKFNDHVMFLRLSGNDRDGKCGLGGELRGI